MSPNCSYVLKLSPIPHHVPAPAVSPELCPESIAVSRSQLCPRCDPHPQPCPPESCPLTPVMSPAVAHIHSCVPSRVPVPSRPPAAATRGRGVTRPHRVTPVGDQLPHRLQTHILPLSPLSPPGVPGGHPQLPPSAGPVSPGVPGEGAAPPRPSPRRLPCARHWGLAQGQPRAWGQAQGTGPPATSPGCRRPGRAARTEGDIPHPCGGRGRGPPRAPPAFGGTMKDRLEQLKAVRDPRRGEGRGTPPGDPSGKG